MACGGIALKWRNALCVSRNTRAASRNAKGTITNSHDLCIFTDCVECAGNDASGELATRIFEHFLGVQSERGQHSSVTSRACPVRLSYGHRVQT